MPNTELVTRDSVTKMSEVFSFNADMWALFCLEWKISTIHLKTIANHNLAGISIALL